MASRFFIVGPDSNWSTTSNWSATSGGASVGAIPTVSDDVKFDANSPNCTVDTINRVCLSFDSAGYTNTITTTFRITVSGAGNIGVGTQWAGDEFLAFTTTATHTSNGNVIRNLWFLGANQTHTLADNFSVINYRKGSGSNVTTVNGNQISISGSFDLGQSSSGVLSGTTNYVMTGTGTLTPSTTTGALRNNLEINTAGTITGASGTLGYNTGTFKWTAGTLAMTALNLDNKAVAATFDLGGKQFGGATLTGTVTVTLSSVLSLSALFNYGVTTQATVLNGSYVHAAGGVRTNNTTGNVSGTTVIKVTATSTLDGPSLTTGMIRNDIEIDPGVGGVVTVSPTFNMNLNRFKIISGSVVTALGTLYPSGGGSGPIVNRGLHGGFI